MHLPGETGVEFLLLQPMVPTSRPNMIAWVAARMDAPNYGADAGLPLPGRHDVFGPAQIEARIDQDPAISAQIIAVEPVGEPGHPGQPDRRATRRLADLSPAGLSPVHRLRVPGVQADRGGIATPSRVGRHPGSGADATRRRGFRAPHRVRRPVRHRVRRRERPLRPDLRPRLPPGRSRRRRPRPPRRPVCRATCRA